MKYKVAVEFGFVEEFEVEANSFDEAVEKGQELADNLSEVPEGVVFNNVVIDVEDEYGNYEEVGAY